MKKYSFQFLLSLLCSISTAQSAFIQYFQNPPDEARPRVWWHWMNGNITEHGIQMDLEWMKRVGIAGFQNFDANLFTPQVVDKKLVFMTPEWKKAFRFATEKAQQLGLEMAIAGSPGWSVTGGPWVPNEDGMKKYVWSELTVEGGQKIDQLLPVPPSETGKFQNHKPPTNQLLGQGSSSSPSHYRDALVVAYRIKEKKPGMIELNPRLSSSSGEFDLQKLTDGNVNNSDFLSPEAVGEDMWLQYEFDGPQTFKAVSIVGALHDPLEDFNGVPLNRRLLVSEDGIEFREVASFSQSVNPQNTLAFAPVSAKYWRLAVRTLPPSINPILAMFGGNPQGTKSDGIDIAEFVLYPTDRIDQFEDKAGFTPWKENLPSFRETAQDIIAPRDVFDISSRMDRSGNLDWVAPPGDWNIIRLGYSLTGRQNHPASPEATGLEVDKLDPTAVRKYINAYLDMYEDATAGRMGESGLSHMILDSYEAGHMNWTKNFSQEFERRRGYEIYPWIPVLTGRVVAGREESEKFLWDFRKTIGEMIAENHYDVIGEELHKRGMKRYTESHEDRRIYLADGMDVKRNADIPMSAMWTPGSFAGGTDEEVRSEADIRESASVAHLYGKKYVAAESMTAIQNAFSWHPEKLKRTADLEMASGLNRFVIHTSVHQPLDDKMPGFSLGPFGQYFTRQETWAEQARPWIDYLARSCHLLQQGRFVADALVYYGENTNLTWRFRETLPHIQGYEYDFVNASALTNILKIEDGKITSPGGGSYSVLVLDESAKQMSLSVLKKLLEMANAGAIIGGVMPEGSPSLADNPREYELVLAELLANPNVYSKQADELLKESGVVEDVLVQENNAPILYVHRQTEDRDIYWLNSRSPEKNVAEVSFRISGKVPELWDPETGKILKLSWRIENNRTIIPLQFDPWGSFFIVFSEKTNDQNFVLAPVNEEEFYQIDGPWRLSFQNNRGAPESAVFESLSSWSESEDPAIKYFSGTAGYNKEIELPALPKKNRIILDLGEVKNLAEIIVNGKTMGILWKAPFRMDITEALKTGQNELEIRVTNLWVNRLIGDAQQGVSQKISFTTLPFYRGNEPLLPSGLMGPVRLLSNR